MTEQIIHPILLQARARAERAKEDALRSAARVADVLVDAVDGGVQELFVNEKRIELEARALLGTIARYRRQTDQWLAATNEINSVLKVIANELSGGVELLLVLSVLSILSSCKLNPW